MFNSNSSVNSPCLKKGPVDKYAAKLSLLYGLPKKEPQSPTKKGRKRSASTSPVVRRKYKTPRKLFSSFFRALQFLTFSWVLIQGAKCWNTIWNNLMYKCKDLHPFTHFIYTDHSHDSHGIGAWTKV